MFKNPTIVITFIIVAFIAGVGLGLFLCQYIGPAPEPIPFVDIPIGPANTYYLNYLNRTGDQNGKLKAVMIDLDQFRSMVALNEQYHPQGGFRIYNGLRETNSVDTIGMMVSLDLNGHYVSNGSANRIVLTSRIHPCPTVCDMNDITRVSANGE
ncbi:MAG TPA: hypothetical protein VK590_14325 [Saprospiraceae bacterium]|nr:hypothetical protein [Saprospiraceae bacterium]